MADNNVEAVERTEETKEVVGELQVVEKEGFWTKTKAAASKVVHSKPFKIIGGVGLAVGGAVLGYSWAKKDDETPEYDYDQEDFDSYADDCEDEVIEDESAIAD